MIGHGLLIPRFRQVLSFCALMLFMNFASNAGVGFAFLIGNKLPTHKVQDTILKTCDGPESSMVTHIIDDTKPCFCAEMSFPVKLGTFIAKLGKVKTGSCSCRGYHTHERNDRIDLGFLGKFDMSIYSRADNP